MSTYTLSSTEKWFDGGCHCGAVRYRVVLDTAAKLATKCNCSICLKKNFFAIRTAPDKFVLLSPASEDDSELGDYAFGSGRNHHRFCKMCGIHCFLKGSFVSDGREVHHMTVNAVTLDPDQDGLDLREWNVTYWDGKADNFKAGPQMEPAQGGIH